MGYSNKTWKCPYYRYDEKRAMHCEGHSTVRFPDRRSIQEYTTAYCASYAYRNCTIAKMIDEYYTRKEREDKSNGKKELNGTNKNA